MQGRKRVRREEGSKEEEEEKKINRNKRRKDEGKREKKEEERIFVQKKYNQFSETFPSFYSKKKRYFHPKRENKIKTNLYY